MQPENTHHAVDDRMFSEQDDFSRSTDKPFPIFPGPLSMDERFSKRELLHRPVHGARDANEVVGGHGYSAGRQESMTEIIQKVSGIFDTDAQTDEIFWETASGPSSWVNGSVATRTSRQRDIMVSLDITYDITQGILIKLLTAPKLTLIPQRRVAPTIRSLSSLSPVSNDKTAP